MSGGVWGTLCVRGSAEISTRGSSSSSPSAALTMPRTMFLSCGIIGLVHRSMCLTWNNPSILC